MAYFNGDLDNPWSLVTFNNTLIFTNGVDPIFKWSGSGSFIDYLAGAYAASYKAKFLARIAERVCLYHTIETGDPKPRRVRWPIPGDPETWSGTGSGALDLDDRMGDDQINGVLELGSNTVAIYGKRTIVIQEYTGNVETPFSFTKMVKRVGLVAPLAILDLNGEHIYLSWDDFYSYSGGRTAVRQGAGVIEELLRTMDPEYVTRSFLSFSEETSELSFHYPALGSEVPNKYLRLNVKTGAWTRGTRTFTCWGTFIETDDQSWDSDDEPWDSDVTRWDDRAGAAKAPINLFGDNSGRVFKSDQSTVNLNGNAVASSWDTKDHFTIDPDGNVKLNSHWTGLRLRLRGDYAKIYYSIDQGVTWEELEDSPLALTSSWKLYELNFEITSTYIRFRVENAVVSSTFDFDMYAVAQQELSDSGSG